MMNQTLIQQQVTEINIALVVSLRFGRILSSLLSTSGARD